MHLRAATLTLPQAPGSSTRFSLAPMFSWRKPDYAHVGANCAANSP